MVSRKRRPQFGCPECENVSRMSQAAMHARMDRRQVIQGAAMAGAAAGLAGTGVAGQEATPGTPAASPVASGAQVDPTATEPQGSFPLVAERETLRVMVPSTPTVQDYATNDFTMWMEEWTNVAIEWVVVPADPGEADAALNLRLAAGDYADVIMNFYPTPTVMELYGAQGTFLPLNDLIEQHGVFTKRAFEEYPTARTVSTATDGNIYALPQVNDCFHCSMSSKLWINQVWLDALGLEVPTTLDAYAEVLRAFKDNDPNGNGQADEFPLTASPLSWHGPLDHFFANSFIYHPGNDLRLIVLDGVVTPIYMQEGWREMIRYLAGLFAEGLIDPEAFTRDVDQMRRIGDGDGGDVAVAGSVTAGWFGEFSTYTPDSSGLWAQYTTVPPLEGPGGLRYSGFNPYGSSTPGCYIVTDKCPNPELAFRWGDALGHIEATTRSIHGVKDVDWAWANEGESGINGDQAIWKSLTDIANVPTQNVHWSQAGPSFRSNAYRLGQYVAPEDAPTDIEVILFEQTTASYEPYKQPEAMTLPPLYFNQEQSQLIAELMPTLEAFVEETMAQAITGASNIDDVWDDYLAQLDAMGLAQFVQYHQEVYDAGQSAS